jgi:hypothetical protein
MQQCFTFSLLKFKINTEEWSFGKCLKNCKATNFHSNWNFPNQNRLFSLVTCNNTLEWRKVNYLRKERKNFTPILASMELWNWKWIEVDNSITYLKVEDKTNSSDWILTKPTPFIAQLYFFFAEILHKWR